MEEIKENGLLKIACLVRCLICLLTAILFILIIFLPIFRIQKSIDLQSILSSSKEDFEDILNGNLSIDFSIFKDFISICSNVDDGKMEYFVPCFLTMFFYIINLICVVILVIYFLKRFLQFFIAYEKNDFSIYINYNNEKQEGKEARKKMRGENGLKSLSFKEQVSFFYSLKDKKQRDYFIGKGNVASIFCISCFIVFAVIYFLFSLTIEDFNSISYIFRTTGVNGFISIPIIFLVAIIGLVIAEKALLKDKKL